MATHGKKYLEAVKQVEPGKLYEPEEAVELVKHSAYAKFDETVELHLHMNLDPRAADQQLRGTVSLPHGLGKKVKVLVFAQGEAVRIAQEAGADYADADELVQKIEGGWLDFDVALATSDVMGKVSKLGKILGRRGLMPNPKSGTIVAPQDLPRAINEARKGRVEFRLDKTAVIHLPLGKVSFDSKAILDNLATVMETIAKARPSGAKGQFIKSAALSSTMGPGIKLDLKTALALRAP